MLLEGLPINGRFKTAQRGGRQTRAERVAEEHYNETARLRASFHVVHGGKDAAYEPVIYHDPVDEHESAKRALDEVDADAERQKRFEAEIGL